MRYIWRSNFVHPYKSLWSILHKFAYLNAVSLPDLILLFGNTETRSFKAHVDKRFISFLYNPAIHISSHIKRYFNYKEVFERKVSGSHPAANHCFGPALERHYYSGLNVSYEVQFLKLLTEIREDAFATGFLKGTLQFEWRNPVTIYETRTKKLSLKVRGGDSRSELSLCDALAQSDKSYWVSDLVREVRQHSITMSKMDQANGERIA